MDWRAAARYAVIGALIIGATGYAVGAFYLVSYKAGLIGAVALLSVLLYVVYAWSKWQGARQRREWERSSPK